MFHDVLIFFHCSDKDDNVEKFYEFCEYTIHFNQVLLLISASLVTGYTHGATFELSVG